MLRRSALSLSQMVSSLQSRITSVPDRCRTFRLTAAKRRTIELFAEYFCLRVHDAAKLLRNHDTSDNDRRSVSRTLELLWRERLASRLPYADLSRERGTISYVYGLTDKAAREFGGKTFDEHSARTLDHELAISHFHMALDRLCRGRGWYLYWQQVDLKTRTIHPDAYFAITDPTKPEGKNTHHFFFEVERSKVSKYKDGEPSILRKLARYYDLFDTQACERDWGFRQFRVVVVQRTEERRRNLCNALVEKCRHRMFWLTTESLYKEDIGTEVFLTPRDHEARLYSFSGIF